MINKEMQQWDDNDFKERQFRQIEKKMMINTQKTQVIQNNT